MKRLAVVAAILLLALPLSAQEGKRAPDFSLKNLAGKTLQLGDYLGNNPIMIDFWATWCTPCKVELPHLDDIYVKYRDRGLIFFAISEDTPRSISKVKTYVRSKKLAVTILLDPDNQVLRKFFSENTLPYTVIIDKQGNIARTFTGYVPGQEAQIEELISRLCGEGSAETSSGE